MILTSLLCACLMSATQQQPFIERFDELSLTEAVELLVKEGYDHGYNGVSAAFTQGEPIGELKQSFANGLRQIRLSSGLSFEEARRHIVVSKVSIETAANEYKGNHYDQALPSLITGIRSYVGKSSATVVMINFSDKLFESLTPWFLYVVLDKNKKWRVDAASPKLPVIVLRLRPEFFYFVPPPVGILPAVVSTLAIALSESNYCVFVP
jgi:hypothetical protein